ncbi:hypothetical protein M1349_05695 [Patescibacteria group bacterium]|nr:hypothetical protein [Patescibacteria group bacterium]
MPFQKERVFEFLRTASDLLEDVGGHPMAAGFTVETKKLELLEQKLFENAKKLLKKEHLERLLRIDTELPPDLINYDTYQKIQKLAPFGMANPEPTFLTKNLIIENTRLVGNDGKHLKLKLKDSVTGFLFDAIAFGIGDSHGLKIGNMVSVVYSLDENEWLARRSLGEGGNGNKNLQLKIKDLRKN